MMTQIKCKLILFVILSHVIVSSTSKLAVVETKFGELEGSVEKSRDGFDYFSFKGVPYGLVNERFQVATQIPKWGEKRKAVNFGNACPQFDVLSKMVIGDENCLFLNVYSPQVKIGEGSTELPVMVFFHPGGFENGKADDYHPKYFMDENVVLVTVNYRLGAFGFLSTGDEIAPGNLGLKDQNLALKWVKEHIKNFGGDSEKITIFGCSAGAASVHYHMLSPASKGLFNNAISQSGSALAPWAFQYGPMSNAIKLAEFLDCPTGSSQQILKCLKTKPVADIVNAQLKFKVFHINPVTTFVPSVEPKNAQNAFLTDSPYSLMESGKFNRVPWITGVTEDEGIFSSATLIMDGNLTKEINDNWTKVGPLVLMYELEDSESQDEVSNKIFDFYFGPDDAGEDTWDSLTDMLSDRFFVYPMDAAARIHAKFSQVYPYVFAFPGGYSPGLRTYFGITEDLGVAHMDELPYFFNGFWDSPEYNDETQQESLHISKSLVKLWASFSKYSEPKDLWDGAKEWQPIPKTVWSKKTKSIKYLQLASKLSVSDTDLRDRMKLWNELALPNCTKSIYVIGKDEL